MLKAPQGFEEFVKTVGYHRIRLQQRIADNRIECNICNRRCRIKTWDFGLCNAVFHAGDDLISTVYGVTTDYPGAENIERLGFLHYKPGARLLCPVSIHCNFGCVFCYQAALSHLERKLYITGYYFSPADIIKIAKEQNAEGIAFSMTESTLQLDFIIDTATLAKQAGLCVIMNSNGYMTAEAIDLLAPVIDAISISVKGLGDAKIYKKWLLRGAANPMHVLQSIKLFHDRGIHVEVTGIFRRSDCEEETNPRNLSNWLAANVDRQVPFVLLPLRPWTLNYPADLFDVSENESNRLVALCRRSGLVHIYNIPRGLAAEEPPNLVTRCLACGNVVVKRKGQITGKLDELHTALFYIPDVCGLNVIDGKGYCKRCNTQIYGVWSNNLIKATDPTEGDSYHEEEE